MLPVPATFDAYADVRRVDFGFTFGIVAPEAADEATASATAQYPASQLQQTHDRVELSAAPFVTLEHNLWLLNGKFQLYPKSVSGIQTGFISENYSDENGLYGSAPTLTFTFSSPQDSYGLTFRFDERIFYGWPSEITLAFFDAGGSEIGNFTAQPNSSNFWVDAPVQQYSKVIITFAKSAVPKRRVRVVEVIFGIVTEYNKSSIANASDQQSIDLLSETLPSAELTVTIDNAEKLYNLINPSGLYQYLQDGQYVNYWYSIGGEKVNAGVRYFSTAKSDDGGLTASITFNDRIVALDHTIFNGGESGIWTLQEAATTILEAAGIKTPPTFENDIGNVTIRKCIPQNTTTREALRMCAQAAMCCCYVDSNDSLHFIRDTEIKPPYTQLEYIQSTGTQYINTGIKLGSNSKIVMDLQYVEKPSGNSGAIGVRNTSRLQFWFFYRPADDMYVSRLGADSVGDAIAFTSTNRCVVELSKDGFIVNGAKVSVPSETFQSTLECYMFCVNNANSVQYPSSIRLYSCKIYESDSLVMDALPVLDGEGVACIYDKTSAKFIYNAGSGDFIAGPVAQEEEPETELDEQLTRDRMDDEPSVNVGDLYNTVTIKRSDTYTDDPEESYTVTVAADGEIQYTKEVQNDLVYDMPAWANWAMGIVRRRTYFDINYRGNPAIQMGDVLQVFDSFGVNGAATVEEHRLDYDGGLDGTIKARR